MDVVRGFKFQNSKSGINFQIFKSSNFQIPFWVSLQ
jgi:hypothetical protein